MIVHHDRGDDGLLQTVRTIGRLAQTLLDLRAEYERQPRADTLAELDRRLGELLALRVELQAALTPGQAPDA